MAQIYSEKVDMDRTPMPIDTGEMQYFDKKRQGFLAIGDQMLDHTLKIQSKRKIAEAKSLKDLTKMRATQVYKNAYNLYPNQPKKYQDTVAKGLKEVYDAVPESDEKTNIMAEVSISGSGYSTRVQKGYWDKQENINNTRIVDQVMSSIKDTQDNLGMTMMTEGDIKKYSSEELAQRQQLQQDSTMTLQQNYLRSKKVDSNGNPVFNATQRALAEEAYFNRGAYAAVDYVQDNVATDYGSAVALVNRMENDPEGFMQETGTTDEARLMAIKESKKILSGQQTAETAKMIRQRRVVADATYKDMGIDIDKNGELTISRGHNNLNSIAAERNRLEEDISLGVYAGDEKEQAKKQAALDLALVTRVEENVGVKGERFGIIKKLGWGKANVGETALMQVDENLNTVVSSLGLDPDTDGEQILNIKAKMIDNTMKDLEMSEGFSLTSRNDSQRENSRKVANNSYFEYVKGQFGDKLVISEKDKQDPVAVNRALKQAMLDTRNEYSQASIDEHIYKYYGNNFGNRADGTQKGTGYLGVLKNNQGSVSTEISVGVNIDGKETEIPTLVPTLTKDETDYLLSGKEPTKEIIDKAVAHARKRISNGKSPFMGES